MKKAVSLGSLSGSGGEKKPKKVWVENEEIAKFKVPNRKMHARFIATTLFQKRKEWSVKVGKSKFYDLTATQGRNSILS